MNLWRSPRVLVLLGTLAAPTFLALAYGPDLGHGFLRDDFAWIRGSRIEGLADVPDLFRRHTGFYRPLVSASFAMNEALSGLEPFRYGATNLLLCLCCVAAIVALGRSVGLGPAWALLAGFIWAVNPHGINMAVLWISGRTALLLTLFWTLAVVALQARRRWLAGVLTAAAVFSKEEAVLLPVLLLAWARFGAPGGERVTWRVAAVAALPATLAVALYLALRAQTSAMWPSTAPDYYKPTFDAATLARNVLEYADRSSSVAAVFVVGAMAAARRLPHPPAPDRRLAWLALAWMAVAFGLTVFLPVRSSLYACLPSVGATLAATILIRASTADVPRPHLRLLAVCAFLLPFALLPVYRRRNVRWVRPAELSKSALDDVRAVRPILAGGRDLVLHDAPGARATLTGAFAGLAQDAVRVHLSLPEVGVWIVPPVAGAETVDRERRGAPLHLFLRDGRLVPLPVP